MKRFLLGLAAVLVLGNSFAPLTAYAAGLLANGDFETGTTTPANWTTNTWGSNTATFAYNTNGHTGAHSVTTTITGYSSGDAKWFPDAITVTPGAVYSYTDWYQSTAQASVGVAVTNTGGVTSYYWLGDPAVASAWTQTNYTFKMPADAVTAMFTHYLRANGSLTIDDVVLSTATALPSAPTVQLTSPTAGTSVSGTVNVTATASDLTAVRAVQFQLDGVNLGSPVTAVPYTTSWNTTAATNAAHTLTAIATNSAGLSTTSGTVSVTVANATAPAPNPVPSASLIPNDGVENATAGAPTSWHDGSWGTNTHSLVYQSTGHSGAHSLATSITSYTNGDAKWYHDDVAVSANASYAYSDWYASTADTEVDAAVTLSNGTVQYYYLTAAPATNGAWQQLKTQFTTPAGAVKVSVFHVIARVGTLQTDDFSLTPYVPAQFNRALVSLTFDDGWRSIYTNGLPALKKYSLPSTQYLLTGTTTYPDYMTVAMMQAFQAQGSEIASHTINHYDLTTLDALTLDSELRSAQSSLRGWMGQSVATNFASPYGAYNPATLTAIKQYYRSHRSVEPGYNSKDNFNIYDIRVQNITNTTTPADVQAWVAQAIATKTWLVLVYHEVDANPADSTYAVTPANLDAELGIVKQSGITVKTVDQALSEITPQL